VFVVCAAASAAASNYLGHVKDVSRLHSQSVAEQERVHRRDLQARALFKQKQKDQFSRKDEKNQRDHDEDGVAIFNVITTFVQNAHNVGISFLIFRIA
jgi:hypothetical protein